MPTLVGIANKARPSSSKASSLGNGRGAHAAADLALAPTMSSPPRSNDAAATVGSAALTLSVGGVNFCLLPSSNVPACGGTSNGGVSFKPQPDGSVILSLTSFSGSLVVSQQGNLVSLQALAAGHQVAECSHATVEEEPHSPDLHDKTSGVQRKQRGGSNSNANAAAATTTNKANKVSPGQQTLPFVVKNVKQQQQAIDNTTSISIKDSGITTPVTKNTVDRKRRNGNSNGDDDAKKSRRTFFQLPTKTTTTKTKAVDSMEEESSPKGTVEAVPVFQSSQTQFTQSDGEDGDDDDDSNNTKNNHAGLSGTVEEVDVSQTMDSSGYTTNDSSVVVAADDNNVSADAAADSGDESVATAHGDEVDEFLDEAGGMKVGDAENNNKVEDSAIIQSNDGSLAIVDGDDVDMTSSAGYPAPPARWGHTVTKIQNDRILVYGGQSFDLEGNPIILSDVHIYSPSRRTWEKPINCRGESRQWHTATYIPERQMIIAFGGETEETTIGNSKKGPTAKVKTSETLRVLDTDIMLWYPPAVSGDIPSGRSGHSATYIPQTNELLLFGGVRASKWLNAVSILDCRTWVWTSPKVDGSPPKPRSYHSATLVGTKVVVFGGNNNRSSFNTVHVLEMVAAPSGNTADDCCTWRWSNPTVSGQAPFPRTGHTATLLQDGKTICIYGGWDPNSDGDGGDGENIFKSSYLLDTQAWTWKEGPKAVAGGSGSPHHHLEDCGPKRCGADAVLNGDEVLIFGGRIPGEILAGDIQRLSFP